MITQNDFSFFLPIITDIDFKKNSTQLILKMFSKSSYPAFTGNVFKIIPPSFYGKCFQNPPTQLLQKMFSKSCHPALIGDINFLLPWTPTKRHAHLCDLLKLLNHYDFGNLKTIINLKISILNVLSNYTRDFS